MNSGSSSSSRVSIPHHLRKTLHSIREITGKQHSDEDIFAVYKESFNDPNETAQKLLFLDTFHEVRSKRERKKENGVSVAQGGSRNGHRNYANRGYGRNASFNRENGANHVSGGFRPSRPAFNRPRNFTAPPRAIKVSGPNGVGNQKAQDDFTASVNKGLAEERPVSKTDSAPVLGVEPEKSKAIAEPVSVVTQDVADQTSQAVVNNQAEKVQPFTFGQQDASRSVSQADQGERSHVTFPFHIQAAKIQQNGLTFGSFGSDFECSHGTGDAEDDSASATDGITEVSSAREAAAAVSVDNDDENSTLGAGGEVQPGELLNTETHQIVYGQGAPLSVFGLVSSLPALGQPINTEAAETQPGNSNVSAISLTYPADHFLRQQYPPSFFPYGPYYPPFYMPHPYIHQFLNPNGIPQQSYYQPGAALVTPSPIQPIGNTENPPTTNSSPEATHISSATTLNSIRSEERSSPVLQTENAAPWIGQGFGNLQMSSMYNLAMQSQVFGFQAMHAGHGGLMGIHHPTQPMAVATTTYRTLPPSPLTTMAMAEPQEHQRIAYQQPQAAQTNWVNNY